MRLWKYLKSFLVLLFLAHVTLTFASTPPTASELKTADKVFALMGKRLEVMGDMALDKWNNSAPEEKTRKSLQEMTATMRTQVEIAKREQRRWRTSWDSESLEKSAAVIELKKWRKQLGARLEKLS